MSDFFVHRAMQIACMTDQQISDIHQIENKRGYAIPNWNIQELFGLPEIKTHVDLPDDPAALSSHVSRIKYDLLLQKIADVQEGAKPWESIATGNIENTHKFDWNVYNAKESKQINFLYQGSTGKKRGGLRSRILSGIEAATGGH